MNEQRNIVFDLHGVLFEDNPFVDDIEQQKLFTPILDGVELLKDCYTIAQASGHKLYACSNWSMSYVDMLEQDFPQIFQMFDGVVTSTIAQAKKPDTKMFRYLLDTYNLVPHHSILIDDQLPNIEAARVVGMSGVHWNNPNDVKNELKRLNVL